MPRARGKHSTNKFAGNVRTRMSNEELREIKEEADLLNITVSQFMRWSAVYSARALKKARNGSDIK